MTVDEIYALSPRELDGAVAECVFGLDLDTIPETCPHCGGWVCQNRDRGWCGSCCVYVNEPEEYSTRMDEAWRVFLHVMERGLAARARFYAQLQWMTRQQEPPFMLTEWPYVLTELRHDMPRAICLAALIACQGEKGAMQDD